MNLLSNLPEGPDSPERETQLAAKIKLGDETALTQLVMANMREAFMYAKTVCKSAIEDGEIFSLCYEALCSSARCFVPGRIRFFAYCKVNIRGAIFRFWKKSLTVKNAEWENKPDIKRAIHTDGETEIEFMTAEDSSELEPHTEPEFEKMHTRERWQQIEPLLAKLTEHEQMILTLRYKSGYTFEQIGTLLGVARSAIGSAHFKALKKLRNHLIREKKYFGSEFRS